MTRTPWTVARVALAVIGLLATLLVVSGLWSGAAAAETVEVSTDAAAADEAPGSGPMADPVVDAPSQADPEPDPEPAVVETSGDGSPDAAADPAPAQEERADAPSGDSATEAPIAQPDAASAGGDEVEHVADSQAPTASFESAETAASVEAAAVPQANGEVMIRMVVVGDPGNAPVGIIPFEQNVIPPGGIYQSCTGQAASCQLVGDVAYRYEVAELETTVAQFVEFLNVVDPFGINEHGLYFGNMSPTNWPKYGSVVFDAVAVPGMRYSVADPEWADKPFGFSNFYTAARFANSLFNGTIVSRIESAANGFEYVTYTVRLSHETSTGMYDLRREGSGGATRESNTGFVVPSQNEWIKAAYYDPNGGGQFSYWQYPTGPIDLNPAVCATWAACAPTASTLNAATGDVTNQGTQPLSSFNPQGPAAPPGTFPYWCPPPFIAVQCNTVNPLGLLAPIYQDLFQGSLSTVGQTLTPSPWGALDMGGNVVEWTDTITPAPGGEDGLRIWRRLHGGISNAPAFQLFINAIGLEPSDNPFFSYTYPWLGFRMGFIQDLTARLAVEKTASPTSVTVGDLVTFDIAVTNVETSTPALGVVAIDHLPAGFAFLSASAGCVHAAGTVTCGPTTVHAHSTHVYSIVTEVTADVAFGVVVNEVTVTWANASAGVTAGLSASVYLNVQPPPSPQAVRMAASLPFTGPVGPPVLPTALGAMLALLAGLALITLGHSDHLLDRRRRRG